MSTSYATPSGIYVPTPFEAASWHMNALDKNDYTGACFRYEYAENHGNRAYKAGGFLGSVAIPSLIPEESSTVRTLDMLRRSSDGTAILVLANMPWEDVKRPTVRRRIGEIHDYIGDNPDVPMSYVVQPYNAGTNIGEITRDANGVFVARMVFARDTGAANFPMSRCDVDVVPDGIPPTYLQDVRSKWLQTRLLNVMLYPRTDHAMLGDEFPNINRGLKWYNALMHELDARAPNNLTTDFCGYATANGYNPYAICGEDAYLKESMTDAFGDKPADHYMGDIRVTISSRALARNMLEGRGVKYGNLKMSASGSPTHRNTEIDRDLTDDEYGEVVSRPIRILLTKIGRAAYYEAIIAGNSDASAANIARSQLFYRMSAFMIEHDEPGQVRERCFDFAYNWVAPSIT